MSTNVDIASRFCMLAHLFFVCVFVCVLFFSAVVVVSAVLRFLWVQRPASGLHVYTQKRREGFHSMTQSFLRSAAAPPRRCFTLTSRVTALFLVVPSFLLSLPPPPSLSLT